MTTEKIPVLYLSYDGLTDPLGQSQVLPYLVGLSKLGYRFTIVSAEKPENYGKRKAVIWEIIAQNGMQWEPVFYTKKPPVVSTLKDMFSMQRKAYALHRQNQFQVVHCRSYLAALVGLAMKRKFGVKFIFDMRGFWADERVEGGLWNLKNSVYHLVYRYFKRREREFLQNADYTISLTYAAEKEIRSWPGLSTIPIQVIPCCVDTELFMPVSFEQSGVSFQQMEVGSKKIDISHSLSPARPAGGEANPQSPTLSARLIPNPFTLSYLGSVGTWYLLDEMLQFFRQLQKHKPEARFLFITPDDPAIILQRARQLNIPTEAITIRKAERSEVPALLAQSQVSLFFIKPSFSKTASSATKMGEILSMGIPIICNAGVGDTEYLFTKYQFGALVHQFNEPAYKAAIEQIDQILQIPPAQLRQAALVEFALDKGVGLYKEVYSKLMAQ